MKLFVGCKTHSEAAERLNAWLDQHYAEQERKICAQWLIEDGDYNNPAEFADEVAQLRAAFAENREECLTVFAAAFDEIGRP